MRYYYNPERLKRIVKSLTAEYKRLAYFKKELLAQLEKQEAKEQKEKHAIKKAILKAELLQKAGFGVGTVREWRGKKYKKVAQGKWRRVYDKEDRGAKMSIARLKKQVEKCESTKELLDLVLQNKSRFMDENGKPLPIVKELSAYAKEKGREKLATKRVKVSSEHTVASQAADYASIIAKNEFEYSASPNAKHAIKSLKENIKTNVAQGRISADKAQDYYSTGKKVIKQAFLTKMIPSGKSEWGATYEMMNEGDSLEAAKFLMAKKTGLVKNAFTGKDKKKREFSVGLCYGDDKVGLKHLIDKHIIQQSDFDSVEDMTKVIQSVLTNGKRKDFSNKAEINNGKYIVILAKGDNDEFVITSFDKTVSENEKQRTAQEQKKKREELNLLVPNSFTQEGTPLPETAKEGLSHKNGTQSNSSVTPPADSVNAELSESASSRLDKGVAEIRKHYEATKSVLGGKKSVILPNGNKIKCRYKIVEADAPTASHNEITFASSDNFPTNANGQNINDRDYQHDEDAKMSVISIGNNYNALALQDLPIVTKDGVVVSGNNRTMSSKLAAKNGRDKAYLSELKEQLADGEFSGLDENDLDGFAHPRLILEIVDEHEGKYTTEEFAQYNKDTKKTMNNVEKAVKLTKTLNAEKIQSIADSINGYETMGELYQDKVGGQEFVQKLIKGGIIGENEKAQFLQSDGLLNDTGKDFVETVLVGTILDENNIRGCDSEGGKSIRKKLLRAILPLVENKGNGKEYSFNKELNEAVSLILEVNRNKEFNNIDSYVKQQDMFGGGDFDPFAVQFAKILQSEGEKKFANRMKELGAGCRESASGAMDIFLGEVESKESLLKKFLDIKDTVKKAFDRFFAQWTA